MDEQTEKAHSYLKRWVESRNTDSFAEEYQKQWGFSQEYACFPDPIPTIPGNEWRNRLIVAEHVRLTETFDRELPGGWHRRDKSCWMPNPEHRGASQHFAQQIRRNMEDFAFDVGLSKLDFRSSEREGKDLTPDPRSIMPFLHRITPEMLKRCVHKRCKWAYDDGMVFIEFQIVSDRPTEKPAIIIWFIGTKPGEHGKGYAKLALFRMRHFFHHILAREIMSYVEPFWIKMHRYGFIDAYD